jgi:hypothetical protein
MAQTKGVTHDGEVIIAIGRYGGRRTFRRIIVAASLALLFLLVLLPSHRGIRGLEDAVQSYLSHHTKEQARLEENRLKLLSEGLRQCALIKIRPMHDFESTRTNPRAVASAAPVLIKNASAIDGDGTIRRGLSILFDRGVIAEISEDLKAPENAKVVDVGGRYVSPGLIDMVDEAAVVSKCSIPMRASTHYLNCLGPMTLMKSSMT